MITLLVITDGRGHFDAMRESVETHLPAFDDLVIVDDSAHKLGFTGAVRKGWELALDTGADYVFHLEDDFTFNRSVPVRGMAEVLESHPYLVQIALLRQPWNTQEQKAGGIVQINPDLYTAQGWKWHTWLEHRRCVTTNPCLWPRWVMERGWPDVEHSEGIFGWDLFQENSDYRAAYWGEGEEWVHHHGQRTGWGY